MLCCCCACVLLLLLLLLQRRRLGGGGGWVMGWEVVVAGSRLRPGGELGGELGGSSGSGDGGGQATTHSGGSTVGLATATKAYSGDIVYYYPALPPPRMRLTFNHSRLTRFNVT